MPPQRRQEIGRQVRSNWTGRYGDRFTKNWWTGRPGWNNPYWHWHRGWGRYPARYWWRPVTVAAVTGWFVGWWERPAYYNYGTTVYYNGDNVYYGEQVAATADQYYEQATTIADNVPKEVTEDETEWLALGVFALTEPDTEASNMLLQLAVNKEGVIAGTLYNETTEATHPVQGSVDRKTQRAAWHIADGTNPGVVMETGIYNLTKDEATALVHFGAEEAQTWLMVRLDAPQEPDTPKGSEGAKEEGQ